jgi:hypothetical protein
MCYFPKETTYVKALMMEGGSTNLWGIANTEGLEGEKVSFDFLNS